MAAWRKEDVEAARRRQEKREAARLGNLLSHTVATPYWRKTGVCMYVWSSHIAEYGSTG